MALDISHRIAFDVISPQMSFAARSAYCHNHPRVLRGVTSGISVKHIRDTPHERDVDILDHRGRAVKPVAVGEREGDMAETVRVSPAGKKPLISLAA